MPFNGSGGFTRVRNWVADAAALIKIRADLHDSEDDNFASGLSNVICRDGQSTISADIPFNAKKITNLANPVNPQDATTKAASEAFATAAALGKITNITLTVLTSSGSYAKPADLKFLEVTCVGGGGGSSNLGNPPAGNCNVGGGGGAGGVATTLFAAASLAASESYTVAAAGGAGGNGGTSLFKGVSASGGTTGLGSGSGTTFTYAAGGSPGFGSGGQLNLVGENGGYGWRAAHGVPTQVICGSGGGNCFAGRIIEIPGTLNGGGAQFPGGGSRGTGCTNNGGAASGGPGAQGCIILKEYR